MTPLLAPCIERRHGRWELNNFIAFSCALRAPEKKLHGWRLIRTEWLAETAIVLRHRTNIQAIRQGFGRRRAEIAHAMDRDRGDPSVLMSFLEAALSRCEQLVKNGRIRCCCLRPQRLPTGPAGRCRLVGSHTPLPRPLRVGHQAFDGALRRSVRRSTAARFLPASCSTRSAKHTSPGPSRRYRRR